MTESLHPTRDGSTESGAVRFSGAARLTVLALAAWFALGGLDFWSGFVAFSSLRLVLLILLSVLLVPFPWVAASEHALAIFSRRPALGWGLLLALAVAGFALFASRELRGANMGDNQVFQTVIQNTANGCFFCYPTEGESYFRFHSNIFLILFAPLTALPGYWFIVLFAQSLVIVAWCRVCGWAWGGNTGLGWLVTLALFLATYTQHAVFYDTKFAALALAVFAVGYYLGSSKILWLGAVAALLTRETTALTLGIFGAVGTITHTRRRMFVLLIIVAAGWALGSYALMRANGGPDSTPRFPPCLQARAESVVTPGCVVSALENDWQLKLAYSLRLLRFAPTPLAFPSIAAALPDLGLTWLSKDYVLYSLGWHYFMQTMGILLVGAGLVLRRPKRGTYHVVALQWVIASCLWQFVTLFRPELF